MWLNIYIDSSNPASAEMTSTCPNAEVSMEFVFKSNNMLPSLSIWHFYTFYKNNYIQGSALQTLPSPTSPQADSGESSEFTWMMIAVMFIFINCIFSITSIALGTALYHKRKCVKSETTPKITLHQDTIGYLCIRYVYIHVCRYVHVYI